MCARSLEKVLWFCLRLNTEQLLKFAEENCSAARAELSKRKLQSDELLEERTQLTSQVYLFISLCEAAIKWQSSIHDVTTVSLMGIWQFIAVSEDARIKSSITLPLSHGNFY